MARTRRTAAALAVVALLLGACGESGDRPGEDRTDVDPTTEPAPVEPTTPDEPEDDVTGDADLPAEVEAAIEDLAEHLGIPAEEVTVMSFESVTWSDGAIGCPEPGMSYTQALVPGTRLVLEADGAEYHYHAGQEPDLVRCDRTPQEPAENA